MGSGERAEHEVLGEASGGTCRRHLPHVRWVLVAQLTRAAFSSHSSAGGGRTQTPAACLRLADGLRKLCGQSSW